jgi:V/A-type H+-transporting ATPase subunit D
VKISKVNYDVRKIAGVKTPVLNNVEFAVPRYSLFSMPSWFPFGIEVLQTLVSLQIKRKIAQRKLVVLEYARKKTTQKVNLYEKVQIPDYREAILKIKRFLEDDENLAKSSQKILKTRLAAAEAMEIAATAGVGA